MATKSTVGFLVYSVLSVICFFTERQRSPDGAPCATYGATPCSTLSFFFDNNFKPASPLGDHIVDKAEEDDDKVDCDKVSAG